MSRVTRSEPRTRSEVEQAVAAAERALEQSTSDLTAARVAYVAAETDYIDGGKRAQLEKKRDAADALERAEALQRRAQERIDGARADHAALVREDRMRELEDLKSKLARFSSTVDAHASAFVAIDRAVDACVMAAAVDVRDAIALHERASAIVRDLRLPEDLPARPDLAGMSHRVRRAVTTARQADGRDPLATAWLAQDAGVFDWRTRDLSPADVAALEREADRNRAIARDREQAAIFAAGVAAGQQNPNPNPNPEPKPKEAST